MHPPPRSIGCGPGAIGTGMAARPRHMAEPRLGRVANSVSRNGFETSLALRRKHLAVAGETKAATGSHSNRAMAVRAIDPTARQATQIVAVYNDQLQGRMSAYGRTAAISPDKPKMTQMKGLSSSTKRRLPTSCALLIGSAF